MFFVVVVVVLVFFLAKSEKASFFKGPDSYIDHSPVHQFVCWLIFVRHHFTHAVKSIFEQERQISTQ